MDINILDMSKRIPVIAPGVNVILFSVKSTFTSSFYSHWLKLLGSPKNMYERFFVSLLIQLAHRELISCLHKITFWGSSPFRNNSMLRTGNFRLSL